MKIAEALQVSTDRILRADTPGTAVVLNRDVERILDGRSADELNDVMLILADIKRSIQRAKCNARLRGCGCRVSGIATCFSEDIIA